jgi:hypothetical protein
MQSQRIDGYDERTLMVSINFSVALHDIVSIDSGREALDTATAPISIYAAGLGMEAGGSGGEWSGG